MTWLAPILAERGWDGTQHRIVGVERTRKTANNDHVAWCECGWHSEIINERDDVLSSALASAAHNAHARGYRPLRPW